MNSQQRIYGLCAVVALSIVFTVAGCSGVSRTKSGPPQSANPNLNAKVHFIIDWPKSGPTRAHVIPQQTNRMVIYVSASDIPGGTLAYVVDRIPSQPSTDVTLGVPAGSKRLFSAEARGVPVVVSGSPVLVNLNDARLSDGQLLASGNDKTAHDISPGATVNAAITLAGSTTPNPGVNNVVLTVNQTYADAFPTVVAFQIIRDQNGNPITNLSPIDFTLTEDGKPATVTDVRTVQQAASNMSVGLVLDRSGSMSGQPNSDLEGAATDFVDLMQPGDAGEVINFSDTAIVDQPFTTDHNALLAAISNHFQGGNTALYDAIDTGIVDTDGRAGRLAVLAMTDGGENASVHNNLASVIGDAKLANVPVFTIGLGSVADQTSLQTLAAQTGGTYTFAPSSSSLSTVYKMIASQLNGQIQLSFISPDLSQTGRTRHVVMNLKYGSINVSQTFTYVM